MSNTDYCGLTEQEANTKLVQWLDKWSDSRWAIDPSAVIEQVECGTSDVDILHKWFTKSLDSCRLIENRLDTVQKILYRSYITDLDLDHLFVGAPTRVRALLKVLGLAARQKAR